MNSNSLVEQIFSMALMIVRQQNPDMADFHPDKATALFLRHQSSAPVGSTLRSKANSKPSGTGLNGALGDR